MPFVLIATGEQYISSSLTAILIATMPLLVALLSVRLSPADRPAALGSIVVLGVACTALGLIAFFQLIAEAGPSRASVVTYVNPLIAVVAGVLALGEQLGAMSLAGLLLILGGSWLSTAMPRQVA